MRSSQESDARPWICAQPVIPGQHLEPAALAIGVLLDLVAQRRPRADHAHVAADDVPELRQLVDRGAAEEAADARDPAVALVDRVAGALLLRADDHRPQLQQLEVGAVLADARLPEEHRAAAVELDGERGERQHRARDRQARARDGDVERAIQRVPSAASHVAGTPRRR